MNIFQPVKVFWKEVLIVVIITATFMFFVSAFMTAEFRSDVSILIVQEQSYEEESLYAIERSSEYLRNIFASAILTETFLNKVIEAPFDIGRIFSSDSRERRREWAHAADVETVYNTGMIRVSIYDENKKDAHNIAQAVVWALNELGPRYYDEVKIARVVTVHGPITSLKPERPDLLANAVLGTIIGLVGSIGSLYFFDYKKRKNN